jgi:hypothetical protein
MRNPKVTACLARLVGVTLPRARAEEKKILKMMRYDAKQ